MPSTTNSLEATHGHLNRKVPRNNQFFTSLFRIHSDLTKKYTNFNDRIKHNYNHLQTKTMNKMLTTDKSEMKKMILFYDTNENNCQCNENKLESEIYGVNIPCRHRLSLGVQFPRIQFNNIDLEFQYDQLIIKEEFVKAEGETQDDNDQLSFEKKCAVLQIKQFSRYKKEKQIKEYVDSKIKRIEDRDGFYIQNQEVSVIQLVEKGIIYFRELKQQNNKQDNK
ncbi:hypothetical protein M9Y10_038063 [Tritrichomonas musculus]|uniref:SWIM-type domain-containing protein n=1 Tax=Tritrichomonas musculus TaxID=1915356 RepID=A0ABR2K884_9EUKA